MLHVCKKRLESISVLQFIWRRKTFPQHTMTKCTYPHIYPHIGIKFVHKIALLPRRFRKHLAKSYVDANIYIKMTFCRCVVQKTFSNIEIARQKLIQMQISSVSGTIFSCWMVSRILSSGSKNWLEIKNKTLVPILDLYQKVPLRRDIVPLVPDVKNHSYLTIRHDDIHLEVDRKN